MSPAATTTNRGEIRYILLTQCLQNDFFVNRECRLYLGDHAALSVLIGRNSKLPPRGGGRLPVSDGDVEQGPLGVFLRAIHDQRRRTGLGVRRAAGATGTLHVINIRDWHEPGPAYDRERRTYG
ncbi:MAG TPA: hypothetical protein VN449_07925, partial [Gaiellaceae bacterium]|nr:hypothetical protein [Gaiellaceae bacterium]